MENLKNKVVVITGASSGFGEAMANRFAEAGARLLLVARGEGALEVVAERIRGRGGEAVAVPGDVKESGIFEKVFSKALSSWGRLDVLINNAGGAVRVSAIEEQSEVDMGECLDLNLTSVINGCRLATPIFKKQKSGLIINITSACAEFAWPEWSVYSAAKAGVTMFSRCLYAELRTFGVAVSVLVPGGSNTGFQKNAKIGFFDWNEAESLRPEHLAEAAIAIARMPRGGVVPKMVVYGQSQEIIPF